MNYWADGIHSDPDGELTPADLAGITACHRQAGVWGWYTADIETDPALHVRTEVLQRYFRDLPPETSSTLAWHSIDDNFSGLNMQNLYVAGKLMQAPSLDAGALLREFVRGFVGEANTPTVTAALRAVELARTRSQLYLAVPKDAVVPERFRQFRNTLDDAWLEDATRAVATALAGMDTVQLSPGFQPAWPVIMEPGEYLQELRAHLVAIRQMLTFLRDARDIERLHAGGASPAQLEAAINALPVVEYDPAHTAGLEAQAYRQKLEELKMAVLRD